MSRGLRDLRTHVPGIWWVEPRPQAIAMVLSEVAALDGQARRRRSDAAASAVREHFGVEGHVSAYHRLYQQVAVKGHLRR